MSLLLFRETLQVPVNQLRLSVREGTGIWSPDQQKTNFGWSEVGAQKLSSSSGLINAQHLWAIKNIYIMNVHCKLTNSTNRLKNWLCGIAHPQSSAYKHLHRTERECWIINGLFSRCFSWLMGECLKPELTAIK
jgi:hypothetical protein